MNRVPKSLLALLVASLLLGSTARLFADQDESLESLRAAKLKTAQEWWDALLRQYSTGAKGRDDPSVLRAAQALRDAQMDVASTKNERIKALETYRDHMRELYEVVEARRPGRALDDEIDEAKIYLIDAKIALKLEAAKP
jgi:hypothetical protein